MIGRHFFTLAPPNRIGAALTNPRITPPLGASPPRDALKLAIYVARSLALPVLLIAMVLGSVIAGLATATSRPASARRARS